MNEKLLLIIPIACSIQIIAHEESNFGVKFSGFVSSEVFFDSRQQVTAREGDILLYPAKEKLDINGDDINHKMNFNFLSIHSRINAGITWPEAFGAKQMVHLMHSEFLTIRKM